MVEIYKVIAYRQKLLSLDTKWLRKGISQITIISIFFNIEIGTLSAHMYSIMIGSLYAAIFVIMIKYLIEKGYICNNLVYFNHGHDDVFM